MGEIEGQREGSVEQAVERRECREKREETEGRAGGCDRWRLSFSMFLFL